MTSSGMCSCGGWGPSQGFPRTTRRVPACFLTASHRPPQSLKALYYFLLHQSQSQKLSYSYHSKFQAPSYLRFPEFLCSQEPLTVPRRTRYQYSLLGFWAGDHTQQCSELKPGPAQRHHSCRELNLVTTLQIKCFSRCAWIYLVGVDKPVTISKCFGIGWSWPARCLLQQLPSTAWLGVRAQDRGASSHCLLEVGGGCAQASCLALPSPLSRALLHSEPL